MCIIAREGFGVTERSKSLLERASKPLGAQNHSSSMLLFPLKTFLSLLLFPSKALSAMILFQTSSAPEIWDLTWQQNKSLRQQNKSVPSHDGTAIHPSQPPMYVMKSPCVTGPPSA
jgi:hypothetical protein